MKQQQFRYKLICFLLLGLLSMAGFWGFRTIPAASTGNPLRESILRLTGQSSSAPADADSVTPSPEESNPPGENFILTGLGQLLPEGATVPPGPTAAPTAEAVSSPWSAPGGIPLMTPDAVSPSPSPPPASPAQSLTQALYEYFSGGSSPVP